VVAPSRGTVAVTDGNEEFVLPRPFAGTVTVRASKGGFHAREYSVPEPGGARGNSAMFEIHRQAKSLTAAGDRNIEVQPFEACLWRAR
jgi:hypothetical protein